MHDDLSVSYWLLTNIRDFLFNILGYLIVHDHIYYFFTKDAPKFQQPKNGFGVHRKQKTQRVHPEFSVSAQNCHFGAFQLVI